MRPVASFTIAHTEIVRADGSLAGKLPAFAVIGIFLLYPAVETVMSSFRKGSYGRLGRWVGFDNYRRLFTDPDFINTLINNVLWIIVAPALIVAMGLGVAVLVALPPWTGPSDNAPAALAARHTAEQLRTNGLTATTSAMRASSPRWLADELTRSWTAQWPRLPEAFEEAADYGAPGGDELNRLHVPMGIVAAVDDPIHPLEVGVAWASAAPQAALRTVMLDEFGPDPGQLGAQCLAALDQAQP